MTITLCAAGWRVEGDYRLAAEIRQGRGFREIHVGRQRLPPAALCRDRNQGLWDLLRSRGGHIDRLRRLHLPSPGKAHDIVRHHKLIVTAIGANELDDAQRHLRKHLSGTLGYLAKIQARFPEYLNG
jgi:hypothetical protein